MPPQARPILGDRQFHVSEFLTKAGDLGGMRVGVVGGGQSGAEAFLDLISRPDDDLAATGHLDLPADRTTSP